MRSILGPCWPVPIFGQGVDFDFPDGNTIDTELPAAFYNYPLIYLQAINEDVRIEINTTEDHDVVDADFLVPEGTTILIGRPEGEGLYIHASVPTGGQSGGELTVTPGELRACGVVNYDHVETTLKV